MPLRLNPVFGRFGQRWSGLTSQMFLFVVLPLATLLMVISLGSLTLHGDAMRDLVGERDERAVRAASAAITEQLNHRAAAVRGLATHAATAGSPGEALTDYAFLLADFEGGLALYDPEGTLLAASNSPELWQARPVADPLRAAGLRPQSAPHFSAGFTDPGSAEPLILVAASALSGPSTTLPSAALGAGRTRPIAVGTFSAASLTRRALGDGLSTDNPPVTLLVDARGQRLYQAGALPISELSITQHPGVAEALRGESGGAHRLVRGSEHVVAYSPVAPVGWALVMEEPWEAVDNPLLRRTQAAPLILIPILLFALVALAFGLRQIVQPLRALEQQAGRLAWGHFEAIEKPVGGIAEIRRLQSELMRMAQKVKTAQQGLRGYINAMTVGQEDERRRLARELHDGTVQALVALDQRAQLAQMTVKDGPPQAAEQLAEVRRMTAALIEEVRRVIRALRPIYLEDLGLLPAIEMLARDLERTSGARVTFAAAGQPRRFLPGHEIAIYRMMQEALNNVARYASARSVSVAAAFHPAEFIIRVQDDGAGFTAPERVSDLLASGHYGLMGMRERAELIGARLSIQSAPGAGTIVELRLPE